MCSLVIFPTLLCCITPNCYRVLCFENRHAMTFWKLAAWCCSTVWLPDWLDLLCADYCNCGPLLSKINSGGILYQAERRDASGKDWWNVRWHSQWKHEHCLEHCLARNGWDGPDGIGGLGGGFAPSDDSSVFIVPSTDRRQWCLPELFITLTWGSSPNKLL